MKTETKTITIKEAIQKIVAREMLLPAIQREYVWKRQDIEKMFDSIMRDYPINTMMFWRIKNISHQPLDFYSFLDPKYTYDVSRNMEFDKLGAAETERLIVIDGQQRLTSLYIGINGTYSTEKGNPTSLFLRLDSLIKDPEEEKQYDFRFMTDTKVLSLEKKGETWFKMQKLLLPKYNIFAEYSNLASNEEVVETMTKLNTLLANHLTYYDICECDNIDDVLEIFTRTNNTGTRLTKGDLLLSVMTTNWMKNCNARDYVNDIISEVKRKNFVIDRDWIIKCCLVVFNDKIKMKVHNFTGITKTIYDNKDNLKEAILESFELIKRFGLVEKGLTSKLAVIPIVYFIYSNKLWNSVNKAEKGQLKLNNYRGEIRKWLFHAIVMNLFESGTDDILSNVKKMIKEYGKPDYFPYEQIEQKYEDTLHIDDKDLENLLNTPKKSAFPILNIIYSQKGLGLDSYDMDHMHPANSFKDLSRVQFETDKDKLLAEDGVTFNSVRNLQLLTETENRSKNKMGLINWINNAEYPDKLKDRHCIPNVSLELKDFATFIDERSILLKKLLKENLGLLT